MNRLRSQHNAERLLHKHFVVAPLAMEFSAAQWSSIGRKSLGLGFIYLWRDQIFICPTFITKRITAFSFGEIVTRCNFFPSSTLLRDVYKEFPYFPRDDLKCSLLTFLSRMVSVVHGMTKSEVTTVICKVNIRVLKGPLLLARERTVSVLVSENKG